MKKIKILLVSLILVLGLASAMIISTQLYIKEQVSEIGRRVGSDAYWAGRIDLGGLLALNYNYVYAHINEETGENEWRNMLATNPTLAYTAVDLYSTDFLEGFKEGFEEGKKENVLQMNDYNTQAEDSVPLYSNNDFDVVRNKDYKNYLRLTLGNMRKYQILIDDLLKLDDTKLNSLINSITKDPVAIPLDENWEPVEKPIEAKELKNWLVSNGHINTSWEMNSDGMPSYYGFPTDVILLTRRVSSSYPDWTNRKTLEEMKKFSVHVQNKLQVQ
jgi:hypothetical protein